MFDASYKHCAIVEIFAFQIYLYRTRPDINRKSGDTLDDHIKAEYMFFLAEYLRLDPYNLTQTELEILISLTMTIYDEAYYNWIKNPHLSQLQSFAETEIKYLFSYIEKIAYFVYDYRTKPGINRQSGNAKDDEIKAKYIFYLLKRLNLAQNRLTVKELELCIPLALSIYDDAYYAWQKNPHLSQLECFANSEKMHLSSLPKVLFPHKSSGMVTA